MLDSQAAMNEVRALVGQWWGDWHREFKTDDLDEDAVVDLAQLIVHHLQVKGGLSSDNPVPQPEGWDEWWHG